jgi:hypothetical protein
MALTHAACPERELETDTFQMARRALPIKRLHYPALAVLPPGRLFQSCLTARLHLCCCNRDLLQPIRKGDQFGEDDANPLISIYCTRKSRIKIARCRSDRFTPLLNGDASSSCRASAPSPHFSTILDRNCSCSWISGQ